MQDLKLKNIKTKRYKIKTKMSWAKSTNERLAHAVVIASPAKICSWYSHVRKVGICNSLATKIEPQEKFLVVFQVDQVELWVDLSHISLLVFFSFQIVHILYTSSKSFCVLKYWILNAVCHTRSWHFPTLLTFFQEFKSDDEFLHFNTVKMTRKMTRISQEWRVFTL